MLDTLHLAHNEQFRNHDLTMIAERQMKVFAREFEPYLPIVNDAEISKELTKWLTDMMNLKMELLVSERLHKICFIPAGTPLDLKAMEAYDDLQILNIRDSTKYRVNMCVTPALVLESRNQNGRTGRLRTRRQRLNPRRFRSSIGSLQGAFILRNWECGTDGMERISLVRRKSSWRRFPSLQGQ
jgi:hypothetical protein